VVVANIDSAGNFAAINLFTGTSLETCRRLENDILCRSEVGTRLCWDPELSCVVTSSWASWPSWRGALQEVKPSFSREITDW
jgi:hypothetical protein